MTNFDEADAICEVNEGGWCHVDGDSGEETYRGVSRKYYPNWTGWQVIDQWKKINGTPHYNQVIDIPGLEEMVKAFYKAYFWDMMKGDEIYSKLFAIYFYDWFVNSGQTAIKKLQETLGIEPQVGNFGPMTLAKVNEQGDALLTKIHARRVQFYYDLVKAVPSDGKFLKGWLARCAHLYEHLMAM